MSMVVEAVLVAMESSSWMTVVAFLAVVDCRLERLMLCMLLLIELVTLDVCDDSCADVFWTVDCNEEIVLEAVADRVEVWTVDDTDCSVDVVDAKIDLVAEKRRLVDEECVD